MLRSTALPAMDDAPTWNSIKKYMLNKQEAKQVPFDVDMNLLNKELESNQIQQAFQVADEKIINYCKALNPNTEKKGMETVLPMEITNAAIDLNTNRLLLSLLGKLL